MLPKDKIIEFYKENDHLLNTEGVHTAEGHLTHRLSDNPIINENAICTNQNPGLGDTLSLFHLPKHFKKNPDKNCYVGAAGYNMLFPTLSKYCPDYVEPKEDSGVKVVNQMEIVQAHLKMGSGHMFQKMQRSLNLEIDLKPKADLFTGFPKQENKVVLNFHAGACQADQKAAIHPRARELYPEHKETIQRFINNNKNKFHFVEVSKWSSDFDNVENKCGMPLAKSIEEVSTAGWYLGLHTGMMHVAAAFDLKSIVILNFPNANRIFLPMMKDYEIVDADWLYPQNVHLHEDEGGELVELLSYESLDKAFAGELYPFFSDEYLQLVTEHAAATKLRVSSPERKPEVRRALESVAETGFIDKFFDGFSKQRHEVERSRWTEVRDSVIKPLSNYDTLSKPVSNEFAGVYVHGGEREFLFENHYAPFLAFRGYSKFRYPIYLFYSDWSNQETDEEVLRIKEIFSPVNIVPIRQLKGHNEYSKFMIREAFHEVEEEKILTFQDDGFLKKGGWEDFVNQFDFDYIGAPWPFAVNRQAGYGEVCSCPEKYGIPKDVKISVGNGGFSFRKKSKMIEVANKVADEDCDWKYDGNQLPEDTFFSYFGFGMNIFKQVPEDIAIRFSREPYHESTDSFGFHRVL